MLDRSRGQVKVLIRLVGCGVLRCHLDIRYLGCVGNTGGFYFLRKSDQSPCRFCKVTFFFGPAEPALLIQPLQKGVPAINDRTMLYARSFIIGVRETYNYAHHS